MVLLAQRLSLVDFLVPPGTPKWRNGDFLGPGDTQLLESTRANGQGSKRPEEQEAGGQQGNGAKAQVTKKITITHFRCAGGHQKIHEAEALGEKDTFFKEKENLDFLFLKKVVLLAQHLRLVDFLVPPARTPKMRNGGYFEQAESSYQGAREQESKGQVGSEHAITHCQKATISSSLSCSSALLLSTFLAPVLPCFLALPSSRPPPASCPLPPITSHLPLATCHPPIRDRHTQLVSGL